MHIGIHNQHGILPSNCICQRHLPEIQFACADIKNVHLFYIISSSSRLGATDEIPNLDVWPKIALQNGRSVSFRGGLEPSDLGDSFGFPKSFGYQPYRHFSSSLQFLQLWTTRILTRSLKLWERRFATCFGGHFIRGEVGDVVFRCFFSRKVRQLTEGLEIYFNKYL